MSGVKDEHREHKGLGGPQRKKIFWIEDRRKSGEK
jgi:hypothetical protein